MSLKKKVRYSQDGQKANKTFCYITKNVTALMIKKEPVISLSVNFTAFEHERKCLWLLFWL